MNTGQVQLLKQLLSCPTAPFREQRVVGFVQTLLARNHIPHFTDPYGNLVIGCDSAAAYRAKVRRQTREPLRLFIAHLDHPGFHGIRWIATRRLSVKWHGGSPVKHLRGSRVWLADSNRTIHGRILKVTLHPSRLAIDTAEILLEAPVPPGQAATDYFGGFRFRAPVWRNGTRLYTQVADDLIGVFAVLNTALSLYAGKHPAAPPFLGLLTRAEEVGFLGAIRHFELDWQQAARRPIVAISLETSRTLPQAHIGKGPVIRLGDRRTVFDPGCLQVLAEVANRVLPGAHQRRVMDGGTCEATAATAWGLPAIGISVPLGNYHNQGMEGGQDCARRDGPAPEFVNLNDVDGLLKLCRGLMRKDLPWEDPWREQRIKLLANAERYRNIQIPKR